MGNKLGVLFDSKKPCGTITEGTQGMVTLHTEKNLKKNIYAKRESVDILIGKNKIINKNNLNTIPTENNEIINQQNIIINNDNCNNNNTLNINTIEGNTSSQIEKEFKNIKNIPNLKNKTAIEGKKSKSIKTKIDYTKREFNNITIIDNLSNYFPTNITLEEVNEMVNIILGEYIIENTSKYIKNQNLNKEQVKAIAKIIYNNIINKKDYSSEDYPLLKDLNIKIGVSELNKDIIEKLFFNGNKISKIQSDLIINNLIRKKKKVKALMIELI